MENAIKERYKLQEAAQILARGDTDGCSKLLCSLRKSVRGDSLKAYRPGSNVHYEPGVDGESFAIKESDLIRSDINILAGGFTWVDREYDDRLNEVLHQVPDDLEVYWDELNTWLADNEPRIEFIFPNPSSVASQGEFVPTPKSSTVNIHKLRNNILDPVIDKAMKQAESKELAAVYLKLRELAITEEAPFTGVVESNSLLYTDSNNEVKKLSYEALRQRLKRR